MIAIIVGLLQVQEGIGHHTAEKIGQENGDEKDDDDDVLQRIITMIIIIIITAVVIIETMKIEPRQQQLPHQGRNDLNQENDEEHDDDEHEDKNLQKTKREVVIDVERNGVRTLCQTTMIMMAMNEDNGVDTTDAEDDEQDLRLSPSRHRHNKNLLLEEPGL